MRKISCTFHRRTLSTSGLMTLTTKGESDLQSCARGGAGARERANVNLSGSKKIDSSPCSAHSLALASRGWRLLKVLKLKLTKYSGSRAISCTGSPTPSSVSDIGKRLNFRYKEIDMQEGRASVDQLEEELQLLRLRLEKEEVETQKLRLEVSSLRLSGTSSSVDERGITIGSRTDSVLSDTSQLSCLDFSFSPTGTLQFEGKLRAKVTSASRGQQGLPATKVRDDDIDSFLSDAAAGHGDMSARCRQLQGPDEVQRSTAELAKAQDNVQRASTKSLGKAEPNRAYGESDCDKNRYNADQQVVECVKEVTESGQLHRLAIPEYEPESVSYNSKEATKVSVDSRSPPQSTRQTEDLHFLSPLANTYPSSDGTPLTATRSISPDESPKSSGAPPALVDSDKPRAVKLRNRQAEVTSRNMSLVTLPASSPDRKPPSGYRQPSSELQKAKLSGVMPSTTEIRESEDDLENLVKTMQRLRREELEMRADVNANFSWPSPRSISAPHHRRLQTPRSPDVRQQFVLEERRTRRTSWSEKDAESKHSWRTPRDAGVPEAENYRKLTWSPSSGSTRRMALPNSPEVEPKLSEARHGSPKLRPSSSETCPKARVPSNPFESQLEESISRCNSCPSPSRRSVWPSDSHSNATATVPLSTDIDLEEDVRQCLQQSRLLLLNSSDSLSGRSSGEDTEEHKLSREASFSVLALARQRRSIGDSSPTADIRVQQEKQAIYEKWNGITNGAELMEKDFASITPSRLAEAMDAWDKKRSGTNRGCLSPQTFLSSRGLSRFYAEANQSVRTA